MNGGLGRGQLNKEDAQKELLSHPPGGMPSVVLEWLSVLLYPERVLKMYPRVKKRI